MSNKRRYHKKNTGKNNKNNPSNNTNNKNSTLADENLDYSRRVFVGGLEDDTSEADLKKYFSQFGKIKSVEIIFNRRTGESKSFGFIFCDNTKTVKKILSRGHKLHGRVIDVNEAFDKERVRRTAWKIISPERKLFVLGLKMRLCVEDLEDYFSTFGSVRRCYIIKDPRNRRKVYGYVEFYSQYSVESVLTKSNHLINKVTVRCFSYEQKRSLKVKMYTSQEEEIMKLIDREVKNKIDKKKKGRRRNNKNNNDDDYDDDDGSEEFSEDNDNFVDDDYDDDYGSGYGDDEDDYRSYDDDYSDDGSEFVSSGDEDSRPRQGKKKMANNNRRRNNQNNGNGNRNQRNNGGGNQNNKKQNSGNGNGNRNQRNGGNNGNNNNRNNQQGGRGNKRSNNQNNNNKGGGNNNQNRGNKKNNNSNNYHGKNNRNDDGSSYDDDYSDDQGDYSDSYSHSPDYYGTKPSTKKVDGRKVLILNTKKQSARQRSEIHSRVKNRQRTAVKPQKQKNQKRNDRQESGIKDRLKKTNNNQNNHKNNRNGNNNNHNNRNESKNRGGQSQQNLHSSARDSGMRSGRDTNRSYNTKNHNTANNSNQKDQKGQGMRRGGQGQKSASQQRGGDSNQKSGDNLQNKIPKNAQKESRIPQGQQNLPKYEKNGQNRQNSKNPKNDYSLLSGEEEDHRDEEGSLEASSGERHSSQPSRSPENRSGGSDSKKEDSQKNETSSLVNHIDNDFEDSSHLTNEIRSRSKHRSFLNKKNGSEKADSNGARYDNSPAYSSEYVTKGGARKGASGLNEAKEGDLKVIVSEKLRSDIGRNKADESDNGQRGSPDDRRKVSLSQAGGGEPKNIDLGNNQPHHSVAPQNASERSVNVPVDHIGHKGAGRGPLNQEKSQKRPIKKLPENSIWRPKDEAEDNGPSNVKVLDRKDEPPASGARKQSHKSENVKIAKSDPIYGIWSPVMNAGMASVRYAMNLLDGEIKLVNKFNKDYKADKKRQKQKLGTFTTPEKEKTVFNFLEAKKEQLEELSMRIDTLSREIDFTQSLIESCSPTTLEDKKELYSYAQNGASTFEPPSTSEIRAREQKNDKFNFEKKSKAGQSMKSSTGRQGNNQSRGSLKGSVRTPRHHQNSKFVKKGHNGNSRDLGPPGPQKRPQEPRQSRGGPDRPYNQPESHQGGYNSGKSGNQKQPTYYSITAKKGKGGPQRGSGGPEDPKATAPGHQHNYGKKGGVFYYQKKSENEIKGQNQAKNGNSNQGSLHSNANNRPTTKHPQNQTKYQITKKGPKNNKISNNKSVKTNQGPVPPLTGFQNTPKIQQNPQNGFGQGRFQNQNYTQKAQNQGFPQSQPPSLNRFPPFTPKMGAQNAQNSQNGNNSFRSHQNLQMGFNGPQGPQMQGMALPGMQYPNQQQPQQSKVWENRVQQTSIDYNNKYQEYINSLNIDDMGDDDM